MTLQKPRIINELERAAWIAGDTRTLEVLNELEIAAEDQAQRSWDEGHAEGHKDGYEYGYDAGLTDGEGRALTCAELVAERHARALGAALVSLERLEDWVNALHNGAALTPRLLTEMRRELDRASFRVEAVDDELRYFSFVYDRATAAI